MPSPYSLSLCSFLAAVLLAVCGIESASLSDCLGFSQDDLKITRYNLVFSRDLSLIETQFRGTMTANAAEALIDSYLEKYEHPVPAEFSPYEWLRNVYYTKQLGQMEPENPRALQGMEVLLAYMQSHLQPAGKGLFVAYPFDYRIYKRLMKSPWVSGFGNAFVLAAYADLYRSTGNSAYKSTADQLVAAFFETRGGNPQGYWFTAADENGYLWFEEYPHQRDPQLHVLNGHIFAIQGLYAYYLDHPDANILLYMQAGITTVQRYIAEFRVPGGIHKYNLSPDAAPDYGQIRNLNQMQWLYDVTGVAYFEEMRALFAADYKASGKKLR
jgi:hypothetical protein